MSEDDPEHHPSGTSGQTPASVPLHPSLGSEYLWRDLKDTWYAALESGGRIYGLARQVPSSEGIVSEYLDRTTGEWVASSALADVFTGIGGVTDAIPIAASRAADIERALRLGHAHPGTQDPPHAR